MNSIENFFKPKSVAIIGASPTEGKVGNILLKNLIDYGFSGKIYPINPKHNKINKLKAYPTVLDIIDEIDLAVVAVPAKLIPQIIQECAWRDKPIRNVTIISAGFSESGELGKELERKIFKIAEENNIKILGPNCLGTIDTFAKLNASFAKTEIKKGEVALVMQSGAFTTALFDFVWGENFGFSKVATLGNKMDLNENDFLDYLAEDKETKIIVLYLESISEGERFKKIITKVSKKKPVLILKAGNSEKVKSAIMSHTGSMAGETDVIKKAIEDAGGLYFDNIKDLFSAIKYFQGFQLPLSGKTLILSNAGGPGVITTDIIEGSEGIEMLELNSSEKESLKKILPMASSVENPVDILGDAQDDRYKNTLEVIKKFDNVGAVIAIVTPQAQTDVEKIAEIFVEANNDFPFPVIPLVMGSESSEIARKIFEKRGLSNFAFPSDAVNAVRYGLLYKNGIKNVEALKEIKISKNKERVEKFSKFFNSILTDEDRNVFYYEEARNLTQAYELKAVDFGDVTKEESFLDSVNYPVVAKVDSPNLLHKNSKNGLELDLNNKEVAQKAIQRLKNDFPEERIIIQSQVGNGLEVIFGIKKDPNFGSVFMCGLGGILTEIFNEKIIWFLPVSAEKIARDLENSKIGKVLKKQKIDIQKVAIEAEKVAQIGFENDWIKELDVNPIIFYKDKESISVDIKILGER